LKGIIFSQHILQLPDLVLITATLFHTDGHNGVLVFKTRDGM